MIDTVKLTLAKGMFMVTDISKFHRGITNAGRGYSILVQNPTKSELKRGIYKPRLSITNRFNTTGRSETTLTIELSLSKLLYGNNFEELQDTDFDLIIDKLQKVLKDMGIRVFRELLIKAPVSAIHYSKNIILNDGTTPHYIIKKIKEANVSLALGIDQTSYRDGGYSYKWHTNTYEVAFYDKLKDLEQAGISEKRAIEKDNSIQLGLFDSLNHTKPFEILRMEVRLNNRQMTKKLFAKLGIESDLTLHQMFKQSISKKVLLHYLNEIKNKRPKLLDYKVKDTQTLLEDIVISNPQMTPARVFQTLGIKFALNSVDNREIRTLFAKKKKAYWYRLNSDIKKVNLETNQNPFLVLDEVLNNFLPVKAVDFQGVLINNDKYK